MAIPPLPGIINTGDPITAAWLQAVHLLLEEFRDNRPLFRGRSTDVDAGSAQAVPGGVDTEMEYSTGAGAFIVAPTAERGGWAAENGGLGIVVPETGFYHVTGWAQFGASTTGVRRAWLLDTGTEISGSRVVASPSGSASIATSFLFGGVIRSFTAGDTIGVSVQQNQTGGADLQVVTFLSASWMQV